MGLVLGEEAVQVGKGERWMGGMGHGRFSTLYGKGVNSLREACLGGCGGSVAAGVERRVMALLLSGAALKGAPSTHAVLRCT